MIAIDEKSDIRYEIFISHCTRLALDDNELILALANALKNRNLRVFLDQLCLQNSQPLVLTLEEAIRASLIGILILTDSSKKSSWFEFELNFMLQRYQAGSLHLLVLCLDEVCTIPNLPQDVNVITPKNKRDITSIADEIEDTVRILMQTAKGD